MERPGLHLNAGMRIRSIICPVCGRNFKTQHPNRKVCPTDISPSCASIYQRMKK